MPSRCGCRAGRRRAQHARDAAAQDRDLRGARAVGRVRVQPEEHALVHADEVEVGGAVDRRAGVRLREGEQLGPACEPLGRVLGAGLAQDAEAGSSPLRWPRKVKFSAASHSMKAAASASSSPSSAAASTAWVRIACQSSTAAHTSPMTRSRCCSSSLSRSGSVWRATSAWITDSRIAPSSSVSPGVRISSSRPLASRLTDEDGMDDQVHAAPAPVQLHADRVDEERHVVGHDLDRGVGGLPPVLLEARVVDAHLRASRARARGRS